MALALVVLPLLAAALVGALPERRRTLAAALAGATMLSGVAFAGALAPAVFAGEIARASVDWLPGVPYAVRIDGLAWTFAMLVCGIGALVVFYAAYYLGDDDSHPRFYALLLAFAGAMLGVVTAGNLIALCVFWEATSLASFLLIGYWHRREDARRGARMALAITGTGGLCLLAGAILIGTIAGSYDLDVVLAAGAAIRADPRFPVALGLVLVGAFTKSAQFPFHFWLPHAMAAPTPVSAYLHSATMVKCGVFLLARLHPALGGNEIWFYAVGGAGLATMLIGAVAALFQQDLKGLLAYSTISHLGLITLLLGLDEKLAVVAAIFHIINHATFKASLFMAAGIIDHETGSRDFRRLNGLMRAMPVTGSLAIVATAAMAGVPLLNGFLSKEMFFAETLAVEGHTGIEWIVPAVALVATGFSVAYSIRFVHDVFFNGEPVGLPRAPHEPPRWMRIPVEVLVVVCLAVGILPGVTVGPVLLLAATAAIGAPPPEYSLAIWHGVNAPLAMSVAASMGGVVLYAALHRWLDLHTVREPPAWGRQAYETVVRSATGLGRRWLDQLPEGRLAPQIALVFLVFTGLVGWPLIQASPPSGPPPGAAPGPGFGWIAAVVFAIGTGAAIATTLLRRRRLVAVILVGGVGLAVSLAFVLMSAPDLALTQLLVEVASVVLMTLALTRLPARSPPERRTFRILRDLAIASAAGVACAAIAWAVAHGGGESLARHYLERAWTEGGGTNVVNVIIVDFRGFDTLGEIGVLGVAALAVSALIAGGGTGTAAAGAAVVPSPLLLTVARLVLPFAAVATVHLFLRGHNQPGGGFIAGLTIAMAVLVVRVAEGAPRVLGPASLPYGRLIGAGLAIAAATGIGSWAWGRPFLTSAFGHPVFPVVGEVPLATAAIFDLGVFVTVVAAVLLALTAFATPRPGARP